MSAAKYAFEFDRVRLLHIIGQRERSNCDHRQQTIKPFFHVQFLQSLFQWLELTPASLPAQAPAC